MIQPLLRDDAFLADLAAPGELRIWWLGQSGFLVRFDGRFLLFDPYLSDSLTTKYAGTDKPHVRMTERVIAPDRLKVGTAVPSRPRTAEDSVPYLSVVTSSHNHTDHLDAETLLPLLAANPSARLVVPEANRAFVAQRLGHNDFAGVDTHGNLSLDGFTLHAAPAAHNEVSPQFLGYVVQCGAWTIYHSGDTLLYPGMVETLRVWLIDVALLPINGNKPERRVAGNLDGREAAQLAHDIGARWVVPCHYDMFEFNTADPRALFIPECERRQQPYRVMRAGEGWTVPAR